MARLFFFGRDKILVFSLLFSLLFCEAVSSLEPKEVSKRLIDKLDQSKIKSSELGIMVGKTQNGSTQTIWSLNESKSMIPASLTKIITAAGILSAFSPSDKLETRLVSSAPISQGELQGDLYLLGGGDPGFVSETMWFLVNELTRSKIKSIRGDIVVDDSRFDAIRNDPSRQEDRVDRAYDAPVGAMSFNWNSVNIFVRPGNEVGESGQIFLDPENTYFRTENKVKTVPGTKTQIQVQRKMVSQKDKLTKDKGRVEVIEVSGVIGIQAKEFVAYKNILSPDLWSGNNLVSFLAQRGIQVAGQVRLGRAPTSAKPLARAESKPMGLLVADMMKFSNNFVAEMLVKNIAAEKKSVPAHLNEGVEWIHNSLKQMGFKENEILYLNPSGLTRENRVTATALHQLLIKMHENFTLFPEALAAFPVAGVDGTLKSRMKNSIAEGRVRAKTGLLTGVVGLAGFGGKTDGSLMSFVFIFNGRPSLGESARHLFDQLAIELLK
ncbi:MAG: D-alanyl-D-alanine carboxypeptidase/D-alanyl-D-alanine-endopeptidase [Bdellovibrionales bacterium]|nr:D-alanyl-D-alanine carboxypeptidase/D-alanyl-D-alanine-endopeptidase [Bdellovibrionales bacterium]